MEKELAEDTFDENVNICSLLIDYCKKISPYKSEVKVEEVKVVDEKEINKTLGSKDWKKDNVTLISGKKSLDDQTIRVGKKGKKV